MRPPDVRHARSGDVAIAYQGVGDGPEVRTLGLEIRVALHTGECEVVDGKVASIAGAVRLYAVSSA